MPTDLTNVFMPLSSSPWRNAAAHKQLVRHTSSPPLRPKKDRTSLERPNYDMLCYAILLNLSGSTLTFCPYLESIRVYCDNFNFDTWCYLKLLHKNFILGLFTVTFHPLRNSLFVMMVLLEEYQTLLAYSASSWNVAPWASILVLGNKASAITEESKKA